MHNKSPRQLWRAASAGIAACVLFAACKRTEQHPEQKQQPEQKPVAMRTIEGQIFVRTQGAETIKLSLVDVLLFDEGVIAQDLEAKRNVAKPIYEGLQPYVKAAEKKEDAAKEVRKAAEKAEHDAGGRYEAHEAWLKAFNAESKAVDEWRNIRGKADYTHSALYYFSDLPAAVQTTKTDADGKFSFKVPSGSYVLVAASSRRTGKETESYYWMVRVPLDADKKMMLANDNLSSSGSADSVIRTPEHEWLVADAMKGCSIDTLMAHVEKEEREQAAAESARQEPERRAQLAQAAKAEMERQAKLEAERQQAQLTPVAKQEMERKTNLESFRKDPKAAQRKAIELYPDLGVVDSPLYTQFRERETIYRIEKKEFFAEPDWPVRLAKECSEALAAKPKTK